MRSGLQRCVRSVSTYVRDHCRSAPAATARSRGSTTTTLSDLGAYGRVVAAEHGRRVIFPEGVKQRGAADDVLRFRPGGLSTLLIAMPTALVVPVAVSGMGEFFFAPRSWIDWLRHPPRFG